MKVYWKYLLCAVFGTGTFVACEDVPEPYNIPTENSNGSSGTSTVEYIANQDFTKGLGDYESVSESGELTWTVSSQYGAVITGHSQDGNGTHIYSPGVTYLVSPLIDLSETESAYVAINQAINYGDSQIADNHKLLIRAGQDGSWAELPMSYDGLGSGWSYVAQNIQIPDEYMGREVQLALKHTCTNTNSTTWEVKSLAVVDGEAPSTDAPVIEGGVGSGTADDPYDVPTTIKLIAAGPPSAKIYTKGIVSKIDEIDTGQYGNATYYISNDGTTTDQLEVFRGYGLGGAKFTSSDDLKKGDEVIVYGQVVYYNNKTMEFTQGSQLYSLNGEVAAGDGTVSGDAEGSGTEDDPYNVAAAVGASGSAWVEGYIVGWVDGQVLSSGANFNANSTSATNLLIADNADETDVANCMPVQLPAGEVRSGLNLKDNPGNYKKQVKLYGSLEKYFGTAGLKSVTKYVLDGESGGEGGGNNDTEAGEASGTGSLEDPYNSVAANHIASALASGQSTDEACYIKGKVVSIKEQFSAQYGNVSFYISDDGTTAGQFYVFRAYYLGNRKWVTGDVQLSAGDDVVVYARLTNYQGNTPETVTGKEGQSDGFIYSLNGTIEGGSGNQGGDDDGGNDDDDVEGIAFAAFANGDFEAWTGGQPDGWKSASTASSATLSQSTDAHGGSYAVCVGGSTSGNKRLAYQEMALEAGTYNCSFWTKAATSSEASLCPGYAVVGSNITYNYDKGDDNKNRYVNNIGSNWQQVTYSFTLSAKSTVCLIIMNSKTTGTDLLIDDFTISKE